MRPVCNSRSERCYGVDISEDGTLVVAERMNGKDAAAFHYPAGAAGVQALREHIESDAAHPRVCIRSCSAAAMAIALGLAVLPRAEVMLVAPHTIESTGRVGRDSAPTGPEARALRLARLAERLT
jgi:hypothetical protein